TRSYVPSASESADAEPDFCLQRRRRLLRTRMDDSASICARGGKGNGSGTEVRSGPIRAPYRLPGTGCSLGRGSLGSMTANGWLQIGFYFVVLLAITKPLGAYMYRVFEGERRPLPRVLGPLERLLYRLSGVDPNEEQTWLGYAAALLVFSAFGL